MTSQTELPEIPLSLKSGHVENRSQKDVELRVKISFVTTIAPKS
jgi:hypothetical protein